MMSDWKQFFFSLIVCSLSCSIVAQIAADSKTKALLRLICGVMLAVTILRPLSSADLETLLDLPELNQNSPEIYIAEGEKNARDELERRIKASCEAYILDKAKKLGADITVQVSLHEDYVPAFLMIQGEVEPEIQRELQKIFTTDLGIPKENQQWIGNQESNSS